MESISVNKNSNKSMEKKVDKIEVIGEPDEKKEKNIENIHKKKVSVLDMIGAKSQPEYNEAEKLD